MVVRYQEGETGKGVRPDEEGLGGHHRESQKEKTGMIQFYSFRIFKLVYVAEGGQRGEGTAGQHSNQEKET